jgi:hypothetical protein
VSETVSSRRASASRVERFTESVIREMTRLADQHKDCAGGQLKQVTYPDSVVVGYQYDRDERLCTVTIGGITTSCTSALATTTKLHVPRSDRARRRGAAVDVSHHNAGRFMAKPEARSLPVHRG